MLAYDVVIIGGGFAGATLGAALSRRGYVVALCDPHEPHPHDFRAEKFSVDQVASLRRLGLSDALDVATPIAWNRVARRGRVVAQGSTREFSFDYAALVERLRDSAATIRIAQRVEAVETDGDRQRVRLNDGRTLRARLVVLATGLALSLRRSLALERSVRSENHSLAIGFDMVADAPAQACALTCFGERIEDRIGYLTLFPIADRLRANLFVYRQPDEDWSRAFRADPAGVLLAGLPSLRALLPAFSIASLPVLRPITLYGPPLKARAGVALIGDAYSTACPAAGGGIGKALVDIEALIRTLPRWLERPGEIGERDIEAFNRDPARLRSQARVLRAAMVARSSALDLALYWKARRWRNYYGMRALSALRRLLHPETPPHFINGQPVASGGKSAASLRPRGAGPLDRAA